MYSPDLYERKGGGAFLCVIAIFSLKGVAEGGRGGGGGHVPPHFQKWGGGTSGFVPPTFWQNKCSNFTICSYFVVKNTFFSKFSRLASLANFTKSIFSIFC